MTTVIAPSLGHGAPFTQLGVGTSPGYDAIDLRRADTIGIFEAPLSMGSYVVSQRGAGANMTVDVASTTGPGCIIQGDHVTQQGRYVIPPHSAIINEAVTANSSGNPRIDSVVLEVKDDTHDASGSNLAQVRIIDGTPTGGVTKEAPGASPAALPSSAILLAYIEVANGAASITNAVIKDMRPKKRGYLLTATSENTTATAYAYNNLTTPDRITQLVVPAGGVLAVSFQGIWQNTVASNGRAAFFLNAVQYKVGIGTGAPSVQEVNGPAETNDDAVLASSGINLTTTGGAGASTEVTTGQIVGAGGATGSGFIEIFVAAGTYDVSLQIKNSVAGTTTVKNRHLWAEVRDYDQCALS